MTVSDKDESQLETSGPGDSTVAAAEVAEVASPSNPTQAQAAAPPDGGWQAWLQVAGSFVLFFNSWGLLSTFGVFQTYYESGALFNESSSNIAWIGAIQAALVYVVALVSGPIYDRGFLRALVWFGSFMVIFGLMTTSVCKEYWEFVLAQGFVTGIGAGCLFVPCVAVLPQYFRSKIGLAVGIASSGSALGGVIYPIVLYRLLGPIGFGWSVRVIAFMALGTLLLPIVILRMRVQPAKIRSLIDWTAFRDVDYLLFTVSTMIGFVSVISMLFYISFYPDDKHITGTKLAFYTLPIFNTASCLGRTIPNWISDKTGPINLIAPGALIFGILTFCMPAVVNTGGFLVLAFLAGFFNGIYIALPPVCFVALTQNKALIGTRMGMGFTFVAFGVLIGGPGSGAILATHHPTNNWVGFWVFSGVCACVSSFLYTILRVKKVGLSPWAKI
ncbi:uncharacterized protein PV06_04084 [Exophiala oligosperma]|uniref:Major facilitator superfamily (MFS) profile domain-containing protein n=2 Tax=Chaetothyriales TaxID=34395 RepID=A0A0D2B0T0_9EURO|nr:uncharacterized protein PV06_04084 [Exophiala oligosperma]KAJ9637428.1 hypothetical protein H2204_004852 [Knufia peltigerae]KIW45721.1 hypothetical protein PV06_04084 [Exophiala oligosperma]